MNRVFPYDSLRPARAAACHYEKIVLVTGAARGIGLATSTTCAQHGATVLMLGRNEETLEQARDNRLPLWPTLRRLSLLRM